VIETQTYTRTIVITIDTTTAEGTETVIYDPSSVNVYEVVTV